MLIITLSVFAGSYYLSEQTNIPNLLTYYTSPQEYTGKFYLYEEDIEKTTGLYDGEYITTTDSDKISVILEHNFPAKIFNPFYISISIENNYSDNFNEKRYLDYFHLGYTQIIDIPLEYTEGDSYWLICVMYDGDDNQIFATLTGVLKV